MARACSLFGPCHTSWVGCHLSLCLALQPYPTMNIFLTNTMQILLSCGNAFVSSFCMVNSYTSFKTHLCHLLYEALIFPGSIHVAAAAAKSLSDSVRPHKRQPTRLRRPWNSPGKNTGVGCHFLLQCVKVKLLSRVRFLATPWTAAHQAPLSMGFSREAILMCFQPRSFNSFLQ